MKFPKPWTLEQTDPCGHHVVCDANGRKLFYVSSDDNPDGEGKPGDPEGPTVFWYSHNDEDTELILGELTELFARKP
jgi:hypothetical protein